MSPIRSIFIIFNNHSSKYPFPFLDIPFICVIMFDICHIIRLSGYKVMLGILKTIFGAGDIVSKGMDLADKMHTSTEEEIQAKNQAKVNILKAYAPFKITQRILAILFASVFVLSFFLVLIMALIQIGNIKDVFLVLDAFYIGEIMLSIVLFYFGGGVAEGIIEKTTDKARESRARLVQNMNGSTSQSLADKPNGRRKTDPNPSAFEDA